MSDRDQGGFLARWSRRKAEQRQGVDTPEPRLEPPRAPPTADVPQPTPDPDRNVEAVPAPADAATTTAAPPLPPPPTLADAQALAPGEEVSRFLAPNVDPGVKNAALKKLFADPHYNVMDGLDTYIDDYNKSDPIPPEMLRQMVQAKFLGLFDDEEQAVSVGPEQPVEAPASQDIPAQAPPPRPDADNSMSHEDADLRLQPDDAVGGSGAREGARTREG